MFSIEFKDLENYEITAKLHIFLILFHSAVMVSLESEED